MIDLVYERDLTAMKFAILRGSYHTKVVLMIAEDLRIQPNQLRKHLIATLDMITLESLASRYDTAQAYNEPDEIREALGYEMYTRFIPIIQREVMDKACMMVITMVQDGYYGPDAIIAAKKQIVEEVFL